MYDPDLASTAETVDFDLLTFEERDAVEAAQDEQLREVLTGLPARPGVKR